MSINELRVNDSHKELPTQPTMVVCVDGCERVSGASGDHRQMPWLKQMLALCAGPTGDSVEPSFTDPNNLSIVTSLRGILRQLHV